MRLLRLDIRDAFHSVDLHPFLTVVDGGSPDANAQLLAAARKLSRGDISGLRGLIQHDGRLVELHPNQGHVIGGATTSACVLVPVDVVGDPAASNVLRYEIEKWSQQPMLDAAMLEKLRFTMDMRGRGRLTNSKQFGPGGSNGKVGSRQAKVSAVVSALEQLASHQRFLDDGDSERARLAQKWQEYQNRHEAHRSHLENLATRLADVRLEVNAAQTALATANESAEPVLLDQAEDDRLSDLADKAARRRYLGRTRLSADEAAEMNELLSKVGATSWTEYAMHRSNPTPSAEQVALIGRAEADLAEAERVAAEVEQECASDSVVRDLEAEEAEIRQLFAASLGPLGGADIQTALDLDQRNSDQRNENPAWRASINRLRDVMSSIGLKPPPLASDAETVEWADRWVAVELGSGLHPTGLEPKGSREYRAQVETTERPSTYDGRTLSGPARRSTMGPGRDHLIRQLDQADRAAVTSALAARTLVENQVRFQQPVATDVLDAIDAVVGTVRQVHDDLASSTPVIVAGDLLGFDQSEMVLFLEALQELSTKVQIILWTQNHHATRWVNAVGPQVGFVSTYRRNGSLTGSI